MEEDIDVTGIPGPNPMLGCGLILFLIGIVIIISVLGYLLFKVGIIQLILGLGILSIAFGVLIMVLCFKVENHGKVWVFTGKENFISQVNW